MRHHYAGRCERKTSAGEWVSVREGFSRGGRTDAARHSRHHGDVVRDCGRACGGHERRNLEADAGDVYGRGDFAARESGVSQYVLSTGCEALPGVCRTALFGCGEAATVGWTQQHL